MFLDRTGRCGYFSSVSVFSDSVSASLWYQLWTSSSTRSKLLVCTAVSFLSIIDVAMCLCCHSVALESRKGKYNINDYDDDDINASSLDTATAGVPSGLWSSAVSLGWVQP